MSDLTIEKDIRIGFPGFVNLYANDLGAYIEAIELMSRDTIEYALESYDYRVYRELHRDTPFLQTTGKLDLEIRHISALRRGIRSPFRGDLALAVFRLSVRASLAEDASEDEFRDIMVERFLKSLERKPMNISRYSWR